MLARRRKLGFSEEEGGRNSGRSHAHSLILSTGKGGEGRGGGCFYQEAGATGGFKFHRRRGRLQLRGVTDEATRELMLLQKIWPRMGRLREGVRAEGGSWLI